MTDATAETTAYWCYSCTRFISSWPDQNANAGVLCPYCDGGFIEESSSAADAPATPASHEVYSVEDIRRRRRTSRRTFFNPVIVLHGGDGITRDRRAYEFYYNDGAYSGLRPVPDSVSEILTGSGFERLLEQLASTNRSGNPPASKSAIESLPKVEISDHHTETEANCVVCTELFEKGTEGTEMPCNHIFHKDCIEPWLLIRNSCPVCRFQLPSEPIRNNEVGMTVWRLPGGGFAVGRFNGGMREGERVLTEMDGGGTRRVSWVRGHHGSPEISVNGASSGNGGRFRRAVRGMVSFMRRVRPNRDNGGESRVMNRSSSLIRRFL